MSRLSRAAWAVINRVDKNLDKKSAPIKWVCPWAELTELRSALHAKGKKHAK